MPGARQDRTRGDGLGDIGIERRIKRLVEERGLISGISPALTGKRTDEVRNMRALRGVCLHSGVSRLVVTRRKAEPPLEHGRKRSRAVIAQIKRDRGHGLTGREAWQCNQ
jgi:hypothetical protein